jgi:hypothetical protein
MVHAYNPSYLGGRGKDWEFEADQYKVGETLSQKQNINESAGVMAEVVRALSQVAWDPGFKP